MSSVVSGGPGQQSNSVASVGKAMAVLQSFTALAPVLSLRQLSARTGIPRSTVHGLCRALTEAGMLEPVPARGYQLGPALVGLGGQVIERTGLVDAAEGVLERVVRRGGTEAHLGQLVGGWIVYLDRASGVIRAPMNNRVGLRALAHETGCGRAALACLSPEAAEAVVEQACRSERTRPPAPEALLASLDEVRARGYALGGRFQPGRLSIAAAVVDPAGVPVGAVSIAGPADLFRDRAVLHETAREVIAVAATIGQRLPRRER